MTVSDRDFGYGNLIKMFGNLGEQAVDVGILQDAGAKRQEKRVTLADGSTTVQESDLTVAEYAAVNEFGSSDGRVPERSFLRSTVDENNAKYIDLMAKGTDKAIERALKGADSGEALRQELGKVGLRAERDVKRKIRDLRDPPNAERTIAEKGSSNPLIDTGRMRQSISHRVIKVS